MTKRLIWGYNTYMNTQDRYTYLLNANRSGTATDAEKAEFYELCFRMLTEVLWENIDVLKRLKDR